MSEPSVVITLTRTEAWGVISALRAVILSAPDGPPEPLSSALEKLNEALEKPA